MFDDTLHGCPGSLLLDNLWPSGPQLPQPTSHLTTCQLPLCPLPLVPALPFNYFPYFPPIPPLAPGCSRCFVPDPIPACAARHATAQGLVVALLPAPVLIRRFTAMLSSLCLGAALSCASLPPCLAFIVHLGLSPTSHCPYCPFVYFALPLAAGWPRGPALCCLADPPSRCSHHAALCSAAALQLCPGLCPAAAPHLCACLFAAFLPHA